MATVLITGANQGIGLAFARTYAVREDTVFATARDPAKADALRLLAPQVLCMPLDVTSDESFAALSARLQNRPIDILIANAGILTGRGGIESAENDTDTWNRILATNVTGAVQTIRSFLPNVRAAKGKIAVISSRMGSSARTGPNTYAYRASKAAISNFVLNLSQELKPEGIAIAALHPGHVRTALGGPNGELSAEDSAAHMVDRIDELTLASTGAFLNWDGTRIPY